MKKIYPLTLILLAVLSCKRKEDILTESKWGGERAPFEINFELRDSSFTIPGNLPKTVPYYKTNKLCYMTFYKDNSFNISFILDSSAPEYHYLNTDSIIDYSSKRIEKIVLQGKYLYKKSEKKLNFIYSGMLKPFNVTRIHGQILGGSGPILMLNDTIIFREDF